MVHGNATSLISITGNASENKNNGMLYACHAPNSTDFSSLLHLLSIHNLILVSFICKNIYVALCIIGKWTYSND